MFTEHDCGQEMTVVTVTAGFGNSHTNWVCYPHLGGLLFQTWVQFFIFFSDLDVGACVRKCAYEAFNILIESTRNMQQYATRIWY